MIETSDAGNGSSFATSDTAAGFVSMSPVYIVLDHTTAPFSSSYSSPPTLVFPTIKVHFINFNASGP